MSISFGLEVYKFHSAGDGSAKQIFPPAERNAEPILQSMKKVFDATTPGRQLLEISSGTGQHVLYFANNFPNITFQPTEYNSMLVSSIAEYAKESLHGNVKEPIFVDISKPCFEDQAGQFDYMLNINLVHVSPWVCTEGLFRTAGKVLKKCGLMITYHALAIDGILEPESNREFDKALRKTNPEWGIRDLRDLKAEAGKNGMSLRELHDMPANNKLCVWQND